MRRSEVTNARVRRQLDSRRDRDMVIAPFSGIEDTGFRTKKVQSNPETVKVRLTELSNEKREADPRLIQSIAFLVSAPLGTSFTVNQDVSVDGTPFKVHSVVENESAVVHEVRAIIYRAVNK